LKKKIRYFANQGERFRIIACCVSPKGIRIERRSKNTKLNEAKRRKQDKFQEEVKFWKIKAE